MGSRVSAGEANEVARALVARASDANLSTFHVELGTTLGTGGVESEQLNTHEVVAWLDARRHVEVVPAAVADHGVDSPRASAHAGFGDLEPLESAGTSAGGVGNGSEIDGDRPYKKKDMSVTIFKCHGQQISKLYLCGSQQWGCPRRQSTEHLR